VSFGYDEEAQIKEAVSKVRHSTMVSFERWRHCGCRCGISTRMVFRAIWLNAEFGEGERQQ